MLSLMDAMVSLVVKVLWKLISLICFRVYLEVNVHKNPTCFSRWGVRLDANTLEEALEGIDRYVEEHPYEYYVNNYKKGRYVIDLYEYEIKNNWIIEEDSD